MQRNFDEIHLLFARKFYQNFGGRSVIFRPEPQENSHARRKFVNLTTKFRLEFKRTETKIQEL